MTKEKKTTGFWLNVNQHLHKVMCIVFVLFIFLNWYHFGSEPHTRVISKYWYDVYNLANSFFINLIAAYIFYLLFVLLPDKRKRAFFRNSLHEQYLRFKKSTIAVLLMAADGSYSMDRVDALCDLEAFRKYFETATASGEKWHDVANGIQGNSHHLDEILTELRILRHELLYVLNNMEIQDQEVFSFFKNLSRIITRFETAKPEYDDMKPLMGFLWEMFTGWNWVAGYQEKDLADYFIGRI
jgi:hypothetical protein